MRLTTTTEVGTRTGWRPVAAVRLREGAVYPWRVRRQPSGDDASGTIRAVGAAGAGLRFEATIDAADGQPATRGRADRTAARAILAAQASADSYWTL